MSIGDGRGRSTTNRKERPVRSNREIDLPESFQLLVDCRDEQDQRALYERLVAEGYSCRVLVL
jgi:hypothetical protein